MKPGPFMMIREATPNPFMTVGEVMACLRVSRGTVRNLVKDGKLRVVRPRPHVPPHPARRRAQARRGRRDPIIPR